MSHEDDEVTKRLLSPMRTAKVTGGRLRSQRVIWGLLRSFEIG